MEKSTYFLKRIFIIISILCVLFMIINAFFIYPSADDFSYTVLRSIFGILRWLHVPANLYCLGTNR